MLSPIGAQPGSRFAVFLAVLYAVLLWAAYRFQITTRWEYLGYSYDPVGAWGISALVIVLVVVPVLLLPQKLTRPGTVVIWLLYLLVYVPSQVILASVSSEGLREIFGLEVVLLIVMVTIILGNILPALPMERLMPGSRHGWFAIAALGVVSYLFVITQIGIPKTFPLISDVYGTRMANRTEVGGAHPAVAYLMSWLAKVLNPMLIASGLASRRYWLVGLGVLGQVALYAQTGLKSTLFSIALIALLVVFIAYGHRWFGTLVLSGTVLLVIGSSLLSVLGVDIMLSLFVRRLIVTPGLMTSKYLEFFSQNPTANLGNSVLAPFVDYPYDQAVPRVIGAEVFGRPAMSANANIWADGLANFGLVGVLAFSVILCGFIWALNSVAGGKSLVITGSIAGIVAYSLSDAALFTTIFTHGLGLTIVMLYLLPREECTRILTHEPETSRQ